PPDGGDLLRVTTVAGGIGTADPRRLQDLRAAATTFFDERGPGALVVDCLDPLVVHSGVERVLRFVDDLHEETATRNALLVVFADARGTNPRMIAWLERELDPFPRTASVPHPEQRGVAAAFTDPKSNPTRTRPLRLVRALGVTRDPPPR